MQPIVDHLLAWYAVPENGLLSVALIAFISATLLPMGSEPAVFGFVKLNPDQFWLTVSVATLANTLGGLTSFWLGLGAKKVLAEKRGHRYLAWLERFGPKMLLLAWLPVVGDPLCAIAGWLQACRPGPSMRSTWRLANCMRYITMTGTAALGA